MPPRGPARYSPAPDGGDARAPRDGITTERIRSRAYVRGSRPPIPRTEDRQLPNLGEAPPLARADDGVRPSSGGGRRGRIHRARRAHRGARRQPNLNGDAPTWGARPTAVNARTGESLPGGRAAALDVPSATAPRRRRGTPGPPGATRGPARPPACPVREEIMRASDRSLASRTIRS